jgi:3-oxoadipate enol-lactonase
MSYIASPAFRSKASTCIVARMVETIRSWRTRRSPRIAVDELGEGPPVTFIHGIGGNRTNWAFQQSYLAEWFRTLAVDLRGYGASDDPPGDLDFRHFVDDLERVLAEADIDSSHIVGLSMGGLVAQALYAAAPHRVRSLTLAGCRPGSEPSFSGEAAVRFAELRLAPLERGAPMDEIADALLPELLSPEASGEIRQNVRGSLMSLRRDTYLQSLRARMNMLPVIDPSDLGVPVLFVTGEQDRVAPLAGTQAFASRVPGARLAVIAQAGHLANIEQPERFNQLVEAFLRECELANGSAPGLGR